MLSLMQQAVCLTQENDKLHYTSSSNVTPPISCYPTNSRFPSGDLNTLLWAGCVQIALNHVASENIMIDSLRGTRFRVS